MQDPQVSVIVPNYNYGRYLSLRLESLLAQTYGNLELIVLDDGSTDDSVSVIQGYEKRGLVKAVYFQTNSGSTYQRWNDGALLAQGQYLLFAGADDYCDRRM